MTGVPYAPGVAEGVLVSVPVPSGGNSESDAPEGHNVLALCTRADRVVPGDVILAPDDFRVSEVRTLPEGIELQGLYATSATEHIVGPMLPDVLLAVVIIP